MCCVWSACRLAVWLPVSVKQCVKHKIVAISCAALSHLVLWGEVLLDTAIAVGALQVSCAIVRQGLSSSAVWQS